MNFFKKDMSNQSQFELALHEIKKTNQMLKNIDYTLLKRFTMHKRVLRNDLIIILQLHQGLNIRQFMEKDLKY